MSKKPKNPAKSATAGGATHGNSGASVLGSRLDFPVLVGGLVLVAALFGLFELAEVARSATPHGLDTRLLLAFRESGDTSNPIGSPHIEGMVRDVTALGSTALLTMITALVVIFLLLAGKWLAALFVLATIGGGQVVSTLLKLGIDRPRPDLVSHMMLETSRSFPSGHAMMSAVVYLTIASLLAHIVSERRIRIFFFAVAAILTLMVGASRVYLGVHWPSDVLAGWLAGAAWTIGCWLIARWWRRGHGRAPW